MTERGDCIDCADHVTMCYTLSQSTQRLACCALVLLVVAVGRQQHSALTAVASTALSPVSVLPTTALQMYRQTTPHLPVALVRVGRQQLMFSK